MCSLCGTLGAGEHWTEAHARPGVFTRADDMITRRRDRIRRVSAANRILRLYGLALSDWQGSSYQLSTFTGRTEMVDSLAHLWPTAERLLGRVCDPLDPDVLSRLERAGG
jgi:hypothetical protein